MRTFIAFVVVTLALVVFGYASLGVARLEGHMADAQQRLATLQYDAAKDSLGEAAQYADHARWVPWLGRDERQEIRARTAALQVLEEGVRRARAGAGRAGRRCR